MQDALAAGVPFPSCLPPQDYAKPVKPIIENDMLNGEAIGWCRAERPRFSGKVAHRSGARPFYL
jgi:hypothetical protein